MSKNIGKKVVAGVLITAAVAGGATFAVTAQGKKEYDKGYESGYDKGHDNGYNEGLKINVGYSEEEVQQKIEEALKSNGGAKGIDFSQVGALSVSNLINLSNGYKVFTFGNVEGSWLYSEKESKFVKIWDYKLTKEAESYVPGFTVLYSDSESNPGLIFLNTETGDFGVMSETEYGSRSSYTLRKFNNGYLLNTSDGKTMYYDFETKESTVFSEDYVVSACYEHEDVAFFWCENGDILLYDKETKETKLCGNNASPFNIVKKDVDGGIVLSFSSFSATFSIVYNNITKEVTVLDNDSAPRQAGNRLFYPSSEGLCYFDSESWGWKLLSEEITSYGVENGSSYFVSLSSGSYLVDLESLEVTELALANGYASSFSKIFAVEGGFAYLTSSGVSYFDIESKTDRLIAADIKYISSVDGGFIVSGASEEVGVSFIDAKTLEVKQLSSTAYALNSCLDVGNGYILSCTNSTNPICAGAYFFDEETKELTKVQSGYRYWSEKRDFEGCSLIFIGSVFQGAHGVIYYDQLTKTSTYFDIPGKGSQYDVSQNGNVISLLYTVDKTEYELNLETKQLYLKQKF